MKEYAAHVASAPTIAALYKPIPEPGDGEHYSYRLYFDFEEPYWVQYNTEDQDFAWSIELRADGQSWASGGILLPRQDGNRIALLADIEGVAGISASVIADALQFHDTAGFVERDIAAPTLVQLPVPPPLPDLSTPGTGPATALSEAFHYRSVSGIQDLACRLVERLGDEFDLFVFHSEFRVDVQEPGTRWFRYSGNAGVSGVGDIGTWTPSCEASRLKGHWVLPVWMKSNHVADDSLDPSARFDFGLLLFAHEFTHTWTAYMSYDRGGQREPLFGDPCNCHWRWSFHTPAAFAWRADEANPKSLMGRRVWRENGDGTFTPIDNLNSHLGGGHSWLDLYAMGLADASEVPDMFILRNLQPSTPATRTDRTPGTRRS